MLGHRDLKLWINDGASDASGNRTFASNTGSTSNGAIGKGFSSTSGTSVLTSNNDASGNMAIAQNEKATISFFVSGLANITVGNWCDIFSDMALVTGYGIACYIKRIAASAFAPRLWVRTQSGVVAADRAFATTNGTTGGIALPDKTHICFIRNGTADHTGSECYVDCVNQTTVQNIGTGAGTIQTYSDRTLRVGRDVANGYGTYNGVIINQLQIFKGLRLPLSDIKRLMMGLHPLTRG